MRKVFLFSSIVLISSIGFSQNVQTSLNVKKNERYYNSWRLGFNLGGMWQTSDLSKDDAGFAGGFTLEKGFFENKTHFFSLAIRGRALFGNTYGYDSKRNYDLISNAALNGTYNSNVNYAGGLNKYIYNNYKTEISEGALELQVSFNRLRERTHVILNLWGGIGFSVFRTNTNLLDKNGLMYNFTKVDSTGQASASNIILGQQDILDKSYESFGSGSKNENTITFSPSAGIGLGYQFNQYFSILWEYKVTFPQGIKADLLDGYSGVNNHWLAGNNDYYHYTGINFLITLGGGGHHTKDTSNYTNVNNYSPANNGTVTTHPNNTVTVNQNGNNYSTAAEKPIVNITHPSNSPHTTYSSSYNIKAKIYHVSSRNELNVTLNGSEVNYYSFDGTNLSFKANLMIGNNKVVITAANKTGSDSKSAILFYTGYPPIITITNPPTNPFYTTVSSINITANVLNISAGSDLAVKLNGNTVTVFTYNTFTNEFASQLQLKDGQNIFEITASNPFGTDFKSVIINYTKPVVGSTVVVIPTNTVVITNTTVTTNTTVSLRGVAVNILDPNTNPYTIKVNSYNVKAKITGINSPSQVTVTVNGISVNFNYDNISSVTFSPLLNLGSNSIVVSAKNDKSSASKSTVIIYEELGTTELGIKTKVICHKKDKSNYETITINEVEWPEHQTHGDYEGACTGVGTDAEIIICHKNDDATSQTMTILQSQWSQHLAHGDQLGECKKEDKIITICHIPPGNNNNPQTITIPESAWPAHAAHGDSKGACAEIIDPEITICHNNGDNSQQTITILQSQWSQHQKHGDQMGECKKEDKKITICHIPPGNNNNPQTITISENAWPAHAAHGDYKGNCVNTATLGGPGQGGDKKINICHKPAGSTPVNMTIKESDWSSHAAHGDTKGDCPTIQQPIKGNDTQIEQPKKEENNNPGRPIKETQIQQPEKQPEQPKMQTNDAGEIKVGRPR